MCLAISTCVSCWENIEDVGGLSVPRYTHCSEMGVGILVAIAVTR